MRRLMFVVLSAAAAAVAVPLAAQATAPQARPAAPVATSEPAPATPAPMAMPASAFPQDVTPPPAAPQRGGRGAVQGIPGQAGGRGRGSANGTPAPAAMGRGGFAPNPATMENIKVDVVLSDSVTQSGGKKTVSMVVTNGRKGQIRSTGNGGGYTLNVDAQPQLLSDGRILVALDLMYFPEATSDAKQVAMINESLSVLVKDGTAMLISQSADPRSDRKVTVELTASTQK